MILKEVQQNLIHTYPFAWDGTNLHAKKLISQSQLQTLTTLHPLCLIKINEPHHTSCSIQPFKIVTNSSSWIGCRTNMNNTLMQSLNLWTSPWVSGLCSTGHNSKLKKGNCVSLLAWFTWNPLVIWLYK